MSGRTPGPWSLCTAPGMITGDGGIIVALAPENYPDSNKAWLDGNAALLLAAPEMLEACKQALLLIHANLPPTKPGVYDCADNLRAAIARAEGRD